MVNLAVSEMAADTLIGGVSGERLELWCKKCGEHIAQLRFHSEDNGGVQLETDCPGCRQHAVFLLPVAPPLRPTASGKL
jgi:Zn finger protein HypA/HybF involved in hydrogenase expression